MEGMDEVQKKYQFFLNMCVMGVKKTYRHTALGKEEKMTGSAEGVKQRSTRDNA